jgi:sialate O-acetylesterase
MMKLLKLLAFILCFNLPLSAQIKLPKLISDGMVLQRDTKVKIWGWASPQENILLSFKGNQYATIADNNGNWTIEMPPQKAGGPFVLELSGKNNITLKDVLFGDVWVCSGQSNMELWMGRLKYTYANEVANANNPNIRQFIVPDKYDFNEPKQDVTDGAWLSVNKKSIYDFSGVAYFFAKELYEKYKIPIGLINSALGGSPAEAWISEEGLQNFPQYLAEAQKFRNSNLIKQIEAKDQYTSSVWYNYINEFDAGYKNKWKDAGFDDKNWKKFTIPGNIIDNTLQEMNGVFWFRKKVNIPAQMVSKPLKLELGRIVDADSVFVNGNFVGSISYQYPPRRYELNGNVFHEGENTIVIRVVSNLGRGGFVADKRYELTSATDTIDLKGEWKYNIGILANPLPAQTFIRWKPMGLYNAMIAPLNNYAIKGVIWYQGESNTGYPKDYAALMQTLIKDWRSKWGLGDFPFFFVQLANFMESRTGPTESAWAELRQEQLRTLSVSKTGMAVAIDIGNWNDIHPENKNEVGHRLALLARKQVYGDSNLVAMGPLYKSMKIVGNKIILSFNTQGSTLVSKNNKPLKHFAIAGVDKKYVWANARIEGNTIVVWSDKIKNPISVRYAWADNPEGANLYNKEELHASPFTTDK